MPSCSQLWARAFHCRLSQIRSGAPVQSLKSSEIDFESLIGSIGQDNRFQYGELWLLDTDSSSLKLESIWQCAEQEFSVLNQSPLSPSTADTLQDLVLKTKQPEWVSTLSESGNLDPDWTLKMCAAGLRSGLGIPVFLKNELIGVGVFYWLSNSFDTKELITISVQLASVLTQEMSLLHVKDFSSGSNHQSTNELDNSDENSLVHYMAYYDLLTDLPNRMLFQDRLTQALDRSKNDRNKFAVFFIDVDRFKTINDSLGHSMGDILLQQVTQRLKSCLRNDDTLARWGGDEFTLLIENLVSEEQVAHLSKRILNAFNAPFPCQGYELHVTCSIGIAIYPCHAEKSAALLQNADAALYQAKQQGRNTFALYNSTMNAQATDRLLLENELRNVLEKDELELHYQPQIDLKTGQVVGAEALLRWRHPKWGLLTPDKFIPLAEETGILVKLTEWILTEACIQARRWQLHTSDSMGISVNLSAREFRNPLLINLIECVLEKTKFPACSLELEITETTAMLDAGKSLEVISELRDMGIKISIDDFGTGYSSISYLRRFSCDRLKIDRSFIQNIGLNSSDGKLSKCMVDLGKNLEMTVVAEGVETEIQLDFLRKINCDTVQGYLFSKPLTASDMSIYLQQSLNCQLPLAA